VMMKELCKKTSTGDRCEILCDVQKRNTKGIGINLVWASPAVLSVMFLYIEFPTPQII
jgi:hypothetical protein